MNIFSPIKKKYSILLDKSWQISFFIRNRDSFVFMKCLKFCNLLTRKHEPQKIY